MDQGEAVQVAPTDAELERAIASVPGILSAVLDRSERTGRSRLRLRLANGEDAETIAWSVAATLRERFGIALDPEAIKARASSALDADPADDPVRLVRDTTGVAPAGRRADGGDATDAPAPSLAAVGDPVPTTTGFAGAADAHDGPAGDGGPDGEHAPVISGDLSARVAIGDLELRVEGHHARAITSVEYGGRTVQGLAECVATTNGTLRAVAEATVDALEQLTSGGLVAGVDRVLVQPADDPATATVVVSVLVPEGEEQLVGACMVRGDTPQAVMRATLDALNRRLGPG